MDKHVYAEAGLCKSRIMLRVKSGLVDSWLLCATTVFALAGQISQALNAYLKANAWQELFTLALSSDAKRTGAEIKVLALEVAERLKDKKRHFEAGRVLLEYARDVEAAIETFVQANAFAEAIRLVSHFFFGTVALVVQY